MHRERGSEGAEVNQDPKKDAKDRDPTGSRGRRVVALKDLVEQREYEVPAEDIADSIIRDAIVVAAPPRRAH